MVSIIKRTNLRKCCCLPGCQNDAVAVIENPDDIFSKRIFICYKHIEDICEFKINFHGKESKEKWQKKENRAEVNKDEQQHDGE